MPSRTARRRIMLWRRGVRECARCGEALGGPDQATLEHIVPRSAGGRTTRSNLTLSHAECNRAAGQRLWLELRRGRETGGADQRPVPGAVWYESLRSTSWAHPTFQIISAIESSTTIAEGSDIRELEDLKEKYGKGSWLKREGQAIVRLDDGSTRRVGLQWYETYGIGRRELKIKRYLDL